MNSTIPDGYVSPINDTFSKATLQIAAGFLILYFAWLSIFVGIRSDHFYFVALLAVGYFASPVSRKFILGFIFFWIFWILYDGMRVYPNYLVNEIHIEDIYNLEKSLFGFDYQGSLVTPNEYFHLNQSKALDLLSGIFYLTWVPLPMAYAVYLFFTDKKTMLEFTACFLFANLVGFVIYYIVPAAPPWYVHFHGFEQNFDIPGNAAQLSNFDEIVGTPIFKNMYNKNANVFAAIPSLHSAYPVVLLYFGLKKRHKIASLIFLIDVLGIWFAAVYSMHHYIIDVILGAFCAIIAIFVFEKVLMKSNFKRLLGRYVNFIS